MADLEKLARDLLVKRPHKIEKSPKRIRVLFNKKYIIDSTQAKYVWEHPYYPQYYVPYDSLETNEVHDNTDSEEGFTILKIEVGQRSTDRVLSFKTGLLRGLVRLEFSSMDAWFEEEQQIYVHPKDPYKRIDIVQSSRTIKVEIEGTVIAESSNVMMLFETSLPARYYLPPTSVNWALLEPTKTVTSCPYKGDANYYTVTINGKEHTDAIWWYKYPTPESIAIAGRLCFYNEKVDIFIDGIKQPRPSSKFG